MHDRTVADHREASFSSRRSTRNGTVGEAGAPRPGVSARGPRSRKALFGVVVFALSGVPGALPASEASAIRTQCGWYANPTPSNHFLFDREGRWVISEQGGFRAQGLEDMPEPDHGPAFWVHGNTGAYGYGCYCLKVQADRERMEIHRILSSRQQPLEVCQADGDLPRFGS